MSKKGEQGQTIPIPLEIKSGISGTFFVGPKEKMFVCMSEYNYMSRSTRKTNIINCT